MTTERDFFDVTLMLPMLDDENYVVLQRDIRLPFVPSTDCSIGLESHSDFNTDEFKVRRVMWNHDCGRFLCEFQPQEYEYIGTGLPYYIKDGWRLRPAFEGCDTEDEAMELAEDNEYVVEVDAKFWVLWPIEYETLRMDTRNFRLVKKPKEATP